MARGARIDPKVLVCAGLVAIGLSGCETIGEGQPAASVELPPGQPVAQPVTTSIEIQAPGEVKYYASDEPLRLGQEYFNRGIYGTAELYFQDATEKAPQDASAWIGLAASYDRTGRFDLADRAYRKAIGLIGPTVQILNNQGYSYMLRGKLRAARDKFMEAYRRDPDNPTIVNNINLLNGSYRFIEREP